MNCYSSYIILLLCIIECVWISDGIDGELHNDDLHVDKTVQLLCDHEIFCKCTRDSLLYIVQNSNIFQDSKSVVDLTLLHKPELINQEYNNLRKKFQDNIPNTELKKFIQENFSNETELEVWLPDDWVLKPRFLKYIADTNYKNFAIEINNIWKTLGRSILPKVKNNPSRHSLIYVKYPFIVPGGRFKEFYYWDTYWIIKGLLISEMSKTVKGILQNFAEIIGMFGYIPNGGRKYYLGRSQPPLFAAMVDEYISFTSDYEFLKNNMKFIIKELEYWNNYHQVKVELDEQIHFFYQFRTFLGEARPESCKEDITLAKNISSQEKRHELYKNLKSAAESGWDFSSRWLVDSSSASGAIDISKTSMESILPVDLNAIMCMNFKIASKFFSILEDGKNSKLYLQKAERLKLSIASIFWDHEQGSWFDYILSEKKRSHRYYASNFVPLWTDCYTNEQSTVVRILQYLENLSMSQFPGGIPVSLFKNSRQQWDFPNGWAPSEHMLIMGLKRTKNIEAQEYSFQLAQKWFRNNYITYKNSKPPALFEKYDIKNIGHSGHGGEYVVQTGFGWTNGVLIDILYVFGKRLSSSSEMKSYYDLSRSIILLPLFINIVGVVTLLLCFGKLIIKRYNVCQILHDYRMKKQYYSKLNVNF